MSIRRLEYFIATVEQGSFMKAGETLFVSASAVNQQVTMLEKEVGVALFDRTHYKPLLTSQGRLFFDSASHIVKEYYQAIESIQASQTIHIGPMGPLEREYIPALIQEYRKEKNGLNFELKDGSFQQMRDSLNMGQMDLIFGVADDFKGANFEYAVLKQLKMVVVCHPDSMLAKQKTLKGKDLKGVPLLMLSKTSGLNTYKRHIQAFKDDGIEPQIVATYDTLSELLTAVRINQGVAVLSQDIIHQEANLISIPLIDTHHQSHYCVAIHQNSTKAVQALYHFIQASFETQTL